MASLEQDEIDRLIKRQQEQALAIGVKEKLNKLYNELYGEDWDKWKLNDICDYCENVLEKLDDDWRSSSIEKLRDSAVSRIIMRK